MLILFFILVPKLLKRKEAPEPVPMKLCLPCSGHTRLAILLVDAIHAPQESARKRLAYLLGSNRQSFCTSWGPPFYEVGGFSTCRLCIIISVESFSPPSSVFNYILFRIKLSIKSLSPNIRLRGDIFSYYKKRSLSFPGKLVKRRPDEKN